MDNKLVTTLQATERIMTEMRMNSQLRDTLRPHGTVMVWMNDEIEPYSVNHNLVVNAGHILIASQFQETTRPDLITHVGLGTGASDFTDATQTTLGTEVGTRVSATITRSNAEVTLAATFAAGNATGNIQEAGCFTASTSGTMYARTQVAPARNKTALDSLTISWVLVF